MNNIVIFSYIVSIIVYTFYCKKNKHIKEMIIGDSFIIISLVYSFFYMYSTPLPGPTEGINFIFKKLVSQIYGVTL